MGERKLPKLHTRVRFPSPAPKNNIIAVKMKKRYHIFSILFSIYFSVFAISPLTCAHSYNDIAAQTDISIKNIRLFAIDLLLTSLAKKESREQNNDNNTTSSCHILLKKKATLSSNKIEI